MRLSRVSLFGFCLIALVGLALAAPATWAAENRSADQRKPAWTSGVEGSIDIFGPEGKEEAKEMEKNEVKKDDECPSTFGPIITDTAIPIETGRFAIQPIFGLSFTTSNFTQSWRRASAGEDFQSLNMSWRLTYGLIKNLEVYAVIPYIHNWASNVDEPGPDGKRSANFGGLGDISLTFKYQLVQETETLPTVSFYFTPTFPSGHAGHLNPRFLGTDVLGSGSYVFTPGLNLSKWVKPFIFYANFWYSMQTANDNGDNGSRQYPRDFVTVNLAAEYPITEKWVACFEYISYFDGGRLLGHKANVAPGALIALAPEIEYMATDKFAMSLGVQCDVAGKNNSANITPLFTMVYTY